MQCAAASSGLSSLAADDLTLLPSLVFFCTDPRSVCTVLLSPSLLAGSVVSSWAPCAVGDVHDVSNVVALPPNHSAGAIGGAASQRLGLEKVTRQF